MSVPRILIADPCPDNRASLALLLNLHGATTEEAGDLAALAAVLRARPVDLVITEVYGSPEATLRAVRVADPAVPVVFHTTRGFPADYGRCTALGCRHFLKVRDSADLVAWATWTGAGGRRLAAPPAAVGVPSPSLVMQTFAGSGTDDGPGPAHDPGTPSLRWRRAGWMECSEVISSVC